MNCKIAVRTWLTSLALLASLAMPASAQEQTGAITGRATDTSGGALPGVTVSITSPNMIGGARTAVTDEQGVYRFTLLPGGEYTVSFMLPGFSTLNVQGAKLNAGATATINGKLEVAALQESVTVTSQSPTIDLEKANIAVNWDQQKLDDLPYSRSLTGLVSLIPGLYATSLDVGGSNFGTGSGPAARTFGRTGGGVVSYDGMIWDQTYGDFGTYEEAQITTAAKGADAMNPGLTMNLVVKSGSNTFKGLGSANYQSGDFQSDNITDELLGKGFAPGVNKFTSQKDYYGEVGGRIIRDRLWFYASHRDASSGQLIPGFIRSADRQQAEFYTKLQDPTGKITYQVTKNNKFEAMAQVGRKWQPYRTREPLRPARIDAEPGLVVAGRSLAQMAIGAVAALDVRRQRAARRVLVAGRAVDERCPQDGSVDDQRSDARRVPRERSHAAALAVWRHVRVLRQPRRPQPRAQVRLSRLAQHPVDREHRLPEPAAVPLSQPVRRRELRRGPQLRRLLRASRLGAGLRLPEHHRRRRMVQLGLLERPDHAEPQAHAQRRRSLRPLFELPAGAGQPGHGSVRDQEHLPVSR